MLSVTSLNQPDFKRQYLYRLYKVAISKMLRIDSVAYINFMALHTATK